MTHLQSCSSLRRDKRLPCDCLCKGGVALVLERLAK